MRLIIYHTRIFIVLSFFCSPLGATIPFLGNRDSFDPHGVDNWTFWQEVSPGKSDDIPKLKTTYPFLFPEKFNDSVWIKGKDSLQLLLLENVEEKFTSMVQLEDNLEYLFKHFKYYFPKTQRLLEWSTMLIIR